MENLATRFAEMPFFARMPWQVRVDLCHALKLERCQKNNNVFVEGDFGEGMYIILTGGVTLASSGLADPQTASGLDRNCPSTAPPRVLGPGDQFGELALLKKGAGAAVRTETATATEECEFATLGRVAYDKTMRAEDISRAHATTRFLSRCAMFRHWGKLALARLSMYCSPVEPPRRGETLVRAGEMAQFVYMLQEGECR